MFSYEARVRKELGEHYDFCILKKAANQGTFSVLTFFTVSGLVGASY